MFWRVGLNEVRYWVFSGLAAGRFDWRDEHLDLFLVMVRGGTTLARLSRGDDPFFREWGVERELFSIIQTRV